MQLPICLFLIFLLPSPALRADDLDSLEQRAISAAVERVAPSVVRIETVGGLESVGGVAFGTGPTTGWIVDPEGYVISSAFNFVNQPSSILIRLPDGSRKPAKLVATDRSRMIVLLKIAVDKPLPVSEISPEKEMRVGQTAIALGRTFDGNEPNVTCGMISALGRIWGKAVQFDASASPNNYGGPLIDLHGRVLGVIVPLSSDAAKEIAGVEWYDSGIGFAIPAEHIMSVLPRFKKGEDLHPGLAGFTMKSTNIYTGDAVLGSCRAKSPAREAGLKADDRIVEIDGRKIARAAELKEEISRRYAGEKMTITVERGTEKPERLTRELTLVEKLENYRHPFFGILPLRDYGGKDEKGVKVRYVYSKSPAQKAGVAEDDLILSLDGKPIDNAAAMLAMLNEMEPNQSVEVEFSRAGKSKKEKIVLSALPETLPPDRLPGANMKASLTIENRPQTGKVNIKIAEFPNEAIAYVPENYTPSHTYGVVVWLHGPGGYKWEETLSLWKPICDLYDVILLAPKSADPAAWMSDEMEFVDKALGELRNGYRVDPLRVAAFGQESGGSMASLVAFSHSDNFRAWAAVDSVIAAMPPEIEPARRFAVFMAVSKKPKQANGVEAGLKKIREQSIPTTLKKLDDNPRPLKYAEIEEMVRFVDMLDRL